MWFDLVDDYNEARRRYEEKQLEKQMEPEKTEPVEE